MVKKFATVKELIAILLECDPEGNVSLSLDAALVDGGTTSEGTAYGFYDLEITCAYSEKDKPTSDCVYFEIGERATQECLAARANSDGSQTNQQLHNNAIVTGAEVAVAIPLSFADYQNLHAIVDSSNNSHRRTGGANTHGELTVNGLLAMLAQDAAMTISRPGSWEGANMLQVLESHGYQ